MTKIKSNVIMKEKEAPEKIYMTPSFGEPDNVLLASFSKSHLNFHRDIEYTRTDAFMKKVENFLEMLGYGFTITGIKEAAKEYCSEHSNKTCREQCDQCWQLKQPWGCEQHNMELAFEAGANYVLENTPTRTHL